MLSGSGAGGTRSVGTGAGDDGVNVTLLLDGQFTQNNFAGRTLANITNTTGIDVANVLSFTAYCVDLGHGIIIPGTYDFGDDPMSIWNLGGDGTDGREAASLYNGYSGSVANGVQRAGLQLAIWEVLFDDSFDLSTGWLRVTSSDANSLAAIAFANSLTVGLSNAAWLRLTDYAPNFAQDFIGPSVDTPSGDVPVPEPATLLLLGSGLASAAAAARRRRSSR